MPVNSLSAQNSQELFGTLADVGEAVAYNKQPLLVYIDRPNPVVLEEQLHEHPLYCISHDAISESALAHDPHYNNHYRIIDLTESPAGSMLWLEGEENQPETVEAYLLGCAAILHTASFFPTDDVMSVVQKTQELYAGGDPPYYQQFFIWLRRQDPENVAARLNEVSKLVARLNAQTFLHAVVKAQYDANGSPVIAVAPPTPPYFSKTEHGFYRLDRSLETRQANFKFFVKSFFSNNPDASVITPETADAWVQQKRAEVFAQANDAAEQFAKIPVPKETT